MVRNGICTRSDLFIMREGIAEESGEMPGVWKVFIKGGDKALEKRPFVTKEKLEEIAELYPTPFHIYDEKGIRENAKKLKEAFAWNPGYKEYYCFFKKGTDLLFLSMNLIDVNQAMKSDCWKELNIILEMIGLRLFFRLILMNYNTQLRDIMVMNLTLVDI